MMKSDGRKTHFTILFDHTCVHQELVSCRAIMVQADDSSLLMISLDWGLKEVACVFHEAYPE